MASLASACGSSGSGAPSSPGGNDAAHGASSDGAVADHTAIADAGVSDALARMPAQDAAASEASVVDGSLDAGGVDARTLDAASDSGDAGSADSGATGCGAGGGPAASVTVGGVAYSLNWHDEFDGTTLDSSHWSATATWCCGQGTNVPQNAYLSGGCLELKAAKSGSSYTSGWVDTQGKYTFTRGYVEIRARLPKGQGMWPALWMDEVSGNPFAEFDILEMLGNDSTTIYETNHTWPQGGGSGTQVHQCTDHGPDFSAGFHVFGFLIEATKITWYVDGTQTCSTTQGINTNPVFLMMNTAVGGVGSWPGAPNSSTVFPNAMDVDYVRVYE